MKNYFINEVKWQQYGEMIGNIAHQMETTTICNINSIYRFKRSAKEMNILSDADFFTTLTAINSSAQYLSNTIEDFRTFLIQVIIGYKNSIFQIHLLKH